MSIGVSLFGAYFTRKIHKNLEVLKISTYPAKCES